MAKIHLNLHQGIIDIEGDEAFVRESFDVVRSSMEALYKGPTSSIAAASPKAEPLAANEGQEKPKTSAKKASGGTGKPGAKYKPKIDSGTNLSALEAFYAGYSTKNNRDKLLVFAAFLRDELGLATCTADQLFTCFMGLKSKLKIPEAFAKNLHDAKVEGYLEYESFSEISITTVGENALVKLTAKAA